MSTTAGTTESPLQEPWSDLPDDLLALVHLRLASPRDRVRLGAVCKAWRAAASRLPAPPPVPLLLVSPSNCRYLNKTKHLCGPDDCWTVRVPEKVEGKLFVGSHDGGWVAAVDASTVVIVNLFSGAKVVVSLVGPANRAFIEPNHLCKIIFSEDPTSSSCILAAIDRDQSYIAVCKVGDHESAWTVDHLGGKTIMDIAFCNGELYGIIYPREELIKFKIDRKEDGTPIITSKHPLAVERRHGAETCSGYLIELHGKPSMAVYHRWLPNHEYFFKVFTLVDNDNDEAYMYKWTEVMSFGDNALFFGLNSSKAVHVTVDGHHGLKRNHIYYSRETTLLNYKLPDDTVYSVTIGDRYRHMYCMKDECVGDGVESTGYYLTDCNYSLLWLYPPCL